MRFLKYILLIGFAAFSSLLWADESALTTNNFPIQATVVVPDQSDLALQQGLRSAFSQVLIQLSDDPGVMQKPDVKNAVDNLNQWVQSYNYDETKNTPGQTTLLLQVNFDRVALQQLIARANPAVVSKIEPTQSSLLISVTNVQSVDDYAKVLRMVRENQSVKNVAVKDVDAEHLLLEIKIAGNREQFQQELAQMHQLKPTLAEFQKTMAPADLYFDWIGNQT